MDRVKIPVLLKCNILVGTGLTMMVYTGVRSLYTTGDVAVFKKDRGLKITDEYNLYAKYGVSARANGAFERIGDMWPWPHVKK